MVAAAAARAAAKGGLKMKPEIYPLAAILGIGMTGMLCFIGYAFTKMDVVINRNAALPPWERINMENPRVAKLLVFNQKFDMNPETRKLRTELLKEEKH